MTAPEAWVWLARIKRTQGRKGEVFAEILTDFPEKFAQRRRLWLLNDRISAQNSPENLPISNTPGPVRDVELVQHWLHKGGIVLHFAGIDSISSAEELAGLIVAIPHSERAQLEEGEVYIADLVGCMLIDVAAPEPRIIGEIQDVDRTLGPVPMLIVKPATPHASPSDSPQKPDDEILIPFAKDYLHKIDLAGKSVEMALPEGLADLNNPAKR